jgi:hypothetical protein
VNNLQKYLLDSTAPIVNQALDQAKEFKFSHFRHRADMRFKYLLRNIVSNALYLKGIYNSLRVRFNRCKITRLSETNWMPLIKVTTARAPEAGTSSSRTYNKTRISCPGISNKYVLCVGGRGKLYPEYRCLIESLGGNLLVYRGNQKGDTDRLPDLLTCADMVICPVDCVNHETYFAVKHFCRKSGKPCALLDRCDLTTFGKGVEILASIPT